MITLDELTRNYAAECDEQLAIVEKSLLALELNEADTFEDHANRALEGTHLIKLGAGLLDFNAASELANLLEHVLALIRWRRIAPTPDRVTVLLSAVDILRALVASTDASRKPAISPSIAALAALCPDGGCTVASSHRRLRALLVEDEPTSRFLLQTFLSRYGDCETAVNGREALERFRAIRQQGLKFDLVCLDIMMPEMDGAEALRQIRALESEAGLCPAEGAKIIMTTAVDDLKQVRQCFWDLCDAYLVKPIDLGKLLNCLRSYHLLTA